MGPLADAEVAPATAPLWSSVLRVKLHALVVGGSCTLSRNVDSGEHMPFAAGEALSTHPPGR
jgi:hypothetical protein